jgi:ribosome-binding protein aMBF1 (putative translation factor)
MSKSLGRKIHRARESAGLTQAVLAQKIEVAPASVAHWEAGTTKPHQSSLEKLELFWGP